MRTKSLKSLIEEAMEGEGNIESYNNALSRIEKLIIKFYGEISADRLEDLKFDWFAFIVENRKYASNLTYLYHKMESDAKVYNLEIPVPVDELSKALVQEYDIDYHMDRPTMAFKLLDVCRPREIQYITMRYYSSPCLTLDEIGKLEGLSQERIRMVINKGLRKIRYWNRKLLRGLCYGDMEDKSCTYDTMQWNIDMSEYSMRHQIPMIASIQIPEEEIQKEEEPIDTKEVAKEEEPEAPIEEEKSQETKPNTKCNESYYDDFYRPKKEFIEQLSNIEEDEDCYKEDECAIDYDKLESKVKEYSKVKLKITNIDDVIVGFWNSKIEI